MMGCSLPLKRSIAACRACFLACFGFGGGPASAVSLQRIKSSCQGINGPVQASKKNNSSGVGRQPSSFEEFEEDVIGAAHELIAAEAAAVRGVMHHDESSQQEVRGHDTLYPLSC